MIITISSANTGIERKLKKLGFTKNPKSWTRAFDSWGEGFSEVTDAIPTLLKSFGFEQTGYDKKNNQNRTWFYIQPKANEAVVINLTTEDEDTVCTVWIR